MSYLYAMQMFIPNYYNPIKIGFSINPDKRKNALTRGPFPTRFLGFWDAPNGVADEHAVHDRFKPFRLYGEWFHPVPEVLEFLASTIAVVPADVVKVQTRVRNFHKRLEAFNAKPATEEPVSAPAASNLNRVDPFDLPDTRITDYLEFVNKRWPKGKLVLTVFELADLAGISVEAIHECFDYIAIRKQGKVPKRHKRYTRELFERAVRRSPGLVPVKNERFDPLYSRRCA